MLTQSAENACSLFFAKQNKNMSCQKLIYIKMIEIKIAPNLKSFGILDYEEKWNEKTKKKPFEKHLTSNITIIYKN